MPLEPRLPLPPCLASHPGLLCIAILIADIVVVAIASAGAQLDDRDTFLGVGTNRLVRWDQRVKEGAVQDALSSPSVVGYAGGKDYARNTNFSCMATSGILPPLPPLSLVAQVTAPLVIRSHFFW